MKELPKLTDEEVVYLVRTKDKNFYSEIIKRYESKLLRYTMYIVGDSDWAADVIQESFIKAYININSFNIKKKFSSWIYRIVHNEAMNVLKKDRKKINIAEDIDFDSGINLEDDFVKKELRAQTNNCLKNIPTIYCEPLTLYFLEEKSYEEIGDILKIPVGTVGTRINRAKAIMKKICQR